MTHFLVKDWNAKRKKAKEESATRRSGVNIREWYGAVPDEIQPKLSQVINAISEKPELDNYFRLLFAIYTI